MPIRKILTVDQEHENMLLRSPIGEQQQQTKEELTHIIQDMRDTMAPTHAAGIAAPQIGEQQRIITLDGSSEKFSHLDIPTLTLINPCYEPISSKKIILWEHCLSLPGRRGKTIRHHDISYHGHTLEGEFIEGAAKGVLAVLIQHEIDHLNGTLLDERLENTEDFGTIEKMEVIYGKNHHKEHYKVINNSLKL